MRGRNRPGPSCTTRPASTSRARSITMKFMSNAPVTRLCSSTARHARAIVARDSQSQVKAIFGSRSVVGSNCTFGEFVIYFFTEVRQFNFRIRVNNDRRARVQFRVFYSLVSSYTSSIVCQTMSVNNLAVPEPNHSTYWRQKTSNKNKIRNE